MRKIEAVLLAILLGAGTPLLQAAQEPTADSSSTPEAATAAPTPPSAYAAQGGCGCQSAGAGGSCLRRLLAWCTYCPKERLGCCHSCNSCQYKGALPLHLFVGRYCTEGSGIHPTLPPDCYHGCQGCGAHGAP